MNASLFLPRIALDYPWFEPLGWTLIHFLWQGAVIGLAAGVLLRLLHSRSANARYAVACAALLACIGAVAGTFVILARPFEKRVLPPRVLSNAPAVTVEVEAAVPTVAASSVSQDQGTPKSSPAIAPQVSPQLPPAATGAPPSAARSASWAMLVEEFVHWAVIGWFVGVLVLGLRLCFAWLRVQGWRYRSTPVTEPALVQLFDRLVKSLRLSPRIRLCVGQHVPSPLTFGWIKPLVLLPAGLVTGLPLEQLEILIAHELAHIRRGDYLVNLFQSAAEVVLFYHPAVWWIGGQIRQIREECCDEIAAQVCPDRLLIARTLVSLAEFRLPPEPALAAGGKSLLARVSRLLGSERREPMLGARNAAWTLTLASVILAALGIVYSARLVSAAEPVEPVAETKPPIRGLVVDENGAPLADARVVLYRQASYWGLRNRIVEEGRTDAAGRFAFTRPMPFRVPNGTNESDYYTLFASRAGHGLGWAQIYGMRAVPDELRLQLGKGSSQEYEVVDQAGKPIAGATVWLRDASSPKTGGSWLLRDSFILPADIGVNSAVTDERGRAVLPDLPDTPRSVAASKDGFEDNLSCSTPREGVPRFVMLPEATLSGRVTNAVGAPVAGAEVWLSPEFKYHQYFVGLSDSDGRYRVKKIWSTGKAPDWGKYKVNVRHPQVAMEERKVAFTSGQVIEGFDLQTQPGTELLGSLRDPATKEGVAGALLLIDSPSGRVSITTDTQGEFRCRVMPGQIHVIFAIPPGGTYVVDATSGLGDMRVFGAQFPLALQLTAPMGKLGVVQGRVVNADGQPVSAGRLTVSIPGSFIDRGGWRGNEWRGDPTSADGSFTLRDMPIGLKFNLLAESSDGKLATIASFAAAEAQTTMPAPLKLHPTMPGEVLIMGGDGRSRPGLKLTVEMLNEGEWIRRREFTSDAQGVVRIANAMPGMTYRFEPADNRSSANSVQLVDPGAANLERRTIVLADTLGIRLEGLDGEVLPIESFRKYYVWIVNRREGGRIRWSNGPLKILSRQDDRVIVPRDTLVLGKPGEKIDFLIATRDGGLVDAEGQMPSDGKGLIVARVKSPPVLPETVPDPSLGVVAADEYALRIVTPEGQPASGAKVSFSGAHWGGYQPTMILELVADAVGVLRVPDAKEKTFSYATVLQPGYAPIFLTQLPLGQPVKATLQATTRLRGRIGGEISSPIDILLTKNKRTNQEIRGYEARDLQYRVSTEKDGTYDFPIEAGKYRFTATSADGRFSIGEVIALNDQTVALPAILRPGHDVALQLLDWPSGQPIAGIEVEIRQQSSDSTNMPKAGSLQTSDAQGLLKWANLLPGSTEFSSRRMSHTPANDQSEYVRWWREDEPVNWRKVDPKSKPLTGRDGVESIYVDIAERAEPIRIYMEKGVKVSGTVVGSNGEPMKGATVAVMTSANGGGGLTGDSRYSMRTDEAGAFAGYIPAGNGLGYWLSVGYWAAAPAPAANAVSEQFSSKPGEQFPFRLSMPKGGWLTGRILDSAGKPAAKYRVSARAADNLDDSYSIRIAEADADGLFRVGPLRPGAYLLEPGTPGRHSPNTRIEGATKATATIADGEEKAVGDLTLPAM